MKQISSVTSQSGGPLDRLWAEAINLPPDGSWLNTFLQNRAADSHPIPNVKEAMKRLSAAGVPAEDLGRVGRAERYEMCFRVLYSLDDPGLKSGKLAGLHKSLADATPDSKRKVAREKAFFKSLWEDIHADDNGELLTEQAKGSANDGPFGDTGPALQRLLDMGASAPDLGRLAAWHRYEACHETLRILAECHEKATETFGLHESLLMADPSGKEGCPGSWPVSTQAASKPELDVQSKSSQDPTVPCFVIPDSDDCDVNASGEVFIAWSNAEMGEPMRVHDLATGEQLSVLKATRDFWSVEMLADGKHVVVSLDRSLAIVEVASGRKVVETRWKWPGTVKPVGRSLLVCATETDKGGNEHETYNLFDLATLKRKRTLEFKEAAGKLQHSLFAAYGKRLALLTLPSHADTYRMTIWSWPEAKCIGQWDTPIAQFAWAPDGSWVATLRPDGVALVEPCSGDILWGTGERQHGLAASPDGRWLASRNAKGTISIWDVVNRRKARELVTKEPVINGLGISTGNKLLVACCNQRCVFWDFKKLVGR